MLRVLSHHGDDRFTWDHTAVMTGDVESIAVVREAERIFAEQRAKGATAVRVRPDAAPERIERFDPEAEQILLIPRVIGG